MIRLMTAATINGGYLNFMGNEFGHPEWIDFPRQGNGWSHKYARRQWSLVDRKELHYCDLDQFDKDMVDLIRKEYRFSESTIEKVWDNEGDQLVAFRRRDLLFIFNFNGEKSFTDYGILVKKGVYNVVLNTDDPKYGGFGFADDSIEHHTTVSHLKNKEWLKLYIPARSALVLRRKD
jgi:1,4-alpha-glucan branching enzyme